MILLIYNEISIQMLIWIVLLTPEPVTGRATLFVNIIKVREGDIK